MRSDKEQDRDFSRKVGEKEERKIRSLRENKRSVWFGLGMMGMVGWSVAVPALLGVLTGLWLDKKYPQTFSWTLTLLVIGVFIGSIIAWYWVEKEDREIHNNKDQENE
ncbi:ATP synthase subunit [Christiangramia fulva]|uniref:ATP synthase subunit n=1 Tax=Christiangramia fulva TaxID=2126553 RepID=A0A2R3Z2G8_9FLAO|nr:AtpZ/AtpI family protein [Christiangramia fulva]AVR44435.1 ATP synthase subunit [Christiangramia fulva]